MLASIDLAAFFALGAVGWWLFVIAGFITLLTLTEYERYGWTGFVVLGILAFLQLVGGVNILGWISVNPIPFVVLILGYAAVGVIYSLVKWRFSFLRQKRERYDELVEDFEKKKREDGTVVAKGQYDRQDSIMDLSRWLKEVHRWDWENIKVRRNKARISAWIAYWPWSLLWTLIDDPFRKMGEWMYATFRGWYEALQANAFKGVDIPK